MPRSNIYETGAASVAELFGDVLFNPPENGSCIALALSSAELGDVERNAIEKSFAALGYGPDACTYAVIGGQAGGDDSFALDPEALFLLVEGLDPLFVVMADEASAQVLGQAYRTRFEPDSVVRVFGRTSVAFRSLAAFMETDAGKQRAWHLFKGIPKRSN